MNQKREQQNQRKSYEEILSREELQQILDGNTRMLVDRAEAIAGYTQQGPPDKRLSSSQIRNIYGTVKKLEMTWPKNRDISRLIMLKPKLAYAAGRHKKIQGLQVMRDVIGDAIDLVTEDEKSRFQPFCRFFEAILAYHKAKGGK